MGQEAGWNGVTPWEKRHRPSHLSVNKEEKTLVEHAFFIVFGHLGLVFAIVFSVAIHFHEEQQ